MEKWINQTFTRDFVVIFRSLFKQELLKTKSSFFLCFAIEKNGVNEKKKSIKGRKGSKDKRQTRKELGGK